MIRKWHHRLKLQACTEAPILATGAATGSSGTASTLTGQPIAIAAGPAAARLAAARSSAAALAATVPAVTEAAALAHAAVVSVVSSRLSRTCLSPPQFASSRQLACLSFCSPHFALTCANTCMYSAATTHVARRFWISPTGCVNPIIFSTFVVSACAPWLNFRLKSLSGGLQQQRRHLTTTRRLQQDVTPPVGPEQTLLARATPAGLCLPLSVAYASLVFAIRPTVPAPHVYFSGVGSLRGGGPSPLRPCCQSRRSPVVFKGRENVARSRSGSGTCSSCCRSGGAIEEAASCTATKSQTGNRSSCCSDRRGYSTAKESNSDARRSWSNNSVSGGSKGCSAQYQRTSRTRMTAASYRTRGSSKLHAGDATREHVGNCSRLQQHNAVVFACLGCAMAALLLVQQACRTEEQRLRGPGSTREAADQTGWFSSSPIAACETCRHVSADSSSYVEKRTREDGSTAPATIETTGTEEASYTTVDTGAAEPSTSDSREDERGEPAAAAGGALKWSLRSNERKGTFMNGDAGARAYKSGGRNSTAATSDLVASCLDTTKAFTHGYQATKDCRGEAKGQAALREVGKGQSRQARELQFLIDEEGEATWEQRSYVADHAAEVALAAKTAEHAIAGDGIQRDGMKENVQVHQRPSRHTGARLSERGKVFPSAECSPPEDEATEVERQEEKTHAAETFQDETQGATAAIAASEMLAGGESETDLPRSCEAAVQCKKVGQADSPAAANENRHRWTAERDAAAAALAQLPPSEAFATMLWQRLWEEKRGMAQVSSSAAGGRPSSSPASSSVDNSSTNTTSTDSLTTSRASFLLARALALGPHWAEAVLQACPQPTAFEYFVGDLLRALHASPAATVPEKTPSLLLWLFQPVVGLFRRSTAASYSAPERAAPAEMSAAHRAITVVERAEAARRAAEALNALASLLTPHVYLPGSLPSRMYDRLSPWSCDYSISSSRHVEMDDSKRGTSENSGNCRCACAVLPLRARYTLAAEYPLRAAAEEGAGTAWLRLLSSKWMDALLQDLHNSENSSEKALLGDCRVLQRWIYGNSQPASSYGARQGMNGKWQNRIEEDASGHDLTADAVLQQEVAAGLLQLLALTVIRCIFCTNAAQRTLLEVQSHHLPLQERQLNLREQQVTGGLERQFPQGLYSGATDAALRRKLAGLLMLSPSDTQQGQERGRAGSASWSSHAQTLWLECVRLAAADGSLIRYITRAHTTPFPSGRGSYLRAVESSSTSISHNVTTASESLEDTKKLLVREDGGLAAAVVLQQLCLEVQRLLPAEPVPAAACLTELVRAAARAQQNKRGFHLDDHQQPQHHLCSTENAFCTRSSILQPTQRSETPVKTCIPVCGVLLANDVGRDSSAAHWSFDNSICCKHSTSQGRGSATSSKHLACCVTATECTNTRGADSDGSTSAVGPLTGYDLSRVPTVRGSPAQTLRLPLLPEVLFSLSVALLDTLHPAGASATPLSGKPSTGFWGASLVPHAVLRLFSHVPSTARGSVAADSSALGAAAAAVSHNSGGMQNRCATVPSPKAVPTGNSPSVAPVTGVAHHSTRTPVGKRGEHRRSGSSTEDGEMLLTVLASLLQSIVESAGLISSAVHSALLPAVDLTVPQATNKCSRATSSCARDMADASCNGGVAAGRDTSAARTTDTHKTASAESNRKHDAAVSSSNGVGAGGSSDTGAPANNKDSGTMDSGSGTSAPAAGVGGHLSRKLSSRNGAATTSGTATSADSSRTAALRGESSTRGFSSSSSSATASSGSSAGLPGGSTGLPRAAAAVEKATAATITSATLQQASSWALRWLRFGRDLPNSGGMLASTEDEAGAVEATTSAPDIGRVLVRLSLKVAELLQEEPQQRLPQRQQGQLLQEANEQRAQSPEHKTDTTSTNSLWPVTRPRCCCPCSSTDAKFEPLRLALTSWMAVQGVDSPHFGTWLEELRHYALQRMRLQLLQDLVERPARLAAAAFFDWDTDAIVLETLALLSKTSSSAGSTPSLSRVASSTTSSSSTSAAHAGKETGADVRWLLPRWFRPSPPPDAVALAAKASSPVPHSTVDAALQTADAASRLTARPQPGAGVRETVLSAAAGGRGQGGAAASSQVAPSDVAGPQEEAAVEGTAPPPAAATARVEAAAIEKGMAARLYVARRRAEIEGDTQQAADAAGPSAKAARALQRTASPETVRAAAVVVGYPGTVRLDRLDVAPLASEEEDEEAVLHTVASDAADVSRSAPSEEVAQLVAGIEDHAADLETEAAEPVAREVREAAVKEVTENTERHEALQQLALLSCCSCTFPVQELWAVGGFTVLWLLACKELELLLRDPVALTLYSRSSSGRRVAAAVSGKGHSADRVKAEVQAPPAAAGQGDAASRWLQQLRQLQWISQGVGSLWRGSDGTIADLKATVATPEALLLAVENARKEREAIWREVRWISRMAANAAGVPGSPLTSSRDCLAGWQKLMLQLVHEVYVHPALLSPLFASLREQIPTATLRLAAPSAVYYEAVRCLHNLFPQPCLSKDTPKWRSATTDRQDGLQPEIQATYLSCIYPFAVPGQPHHLIDPLLMLPPLHSPLPRILQRFKTAAHSTPAINDDDDLGSARASATSPHVEAGACRHVGGAAGNTESCRAGRTTVPVQVAGFSASAEHADAATSPLTGGQTFLPCSSAAVASSPPSTTAPAAVGPEIFRVAPGGVVGQEGRLDQGKPQVLLYKPHLPTRRLTEKQLQKLLRALEQHQQKQLRDIQQRRRLQCRQHPQHQQEEQERRDLEIIDSDVVSEGTLHGHIGERNFPGNEMQTASRQGSPPQHCVDATTTRGRQGAGAGEWQTCANTDAGVEERPLEGTFQPRRERTNCGEASSLHKQSAVCSGECSSNSGGGKRTNLHNIRRRSSSNKPHATSVGELCGEAPFIIFLHGLRGSAWRTWRCSHCGNEFVVHDDVSLERGRTDVFPSASSGSGSTKDRSNGREANSSSFTSSGVTSGQSDINTSGCRVFQQGHGKEVPQALFQSRVSSSSKLAVPVDDPNALDKDACSDFSSPDGAARPSDSVSAGALPWSVADAAAADTPRGYEGGSGAAGLLSTSSGTAAPPSATAATASAASKLAATVPTPKTEASYTAPIMTKGSPRCACYMLRDTAKQMKLEEKDYIGSTQSFYYLWPRQLLAQQFPKCCILSVDYQAPLFRKPVPFCRQPLASAAPAGIAEEEQKSQPCAATAAAAAECSPEADAAAARGVHLSATATEVAEEASAGGSTLASKDFEDTKAAVRMGLSLHPMSKVFISQEQQRFASSHANNNHSSSSRSTVSQGKKQKSSGDNASSSSSSVSSDRARRSFKRDAAAAAAAAAFAVAEQDEWGDADAWGAAGGSAEEEGPTLWQLGRCVQRQLKAAGVGQGERPIIFVAHSMGGLIAEYLLLHDSAIRRNTRAILFFSTPHLGSPLADREWLRMVARPLLPLYVQQLSPGDATLRSLSSSFARLLDSAAGKHIRIAAVGELRPTPLPYIGGSAMVVPPWSSLPSWLHAQPAVLIDANHSHTCKPASSNDIRYTILEELIQETLEGGEREATAESRSGASCGRKHAAEQQEF